MCKIAEPHELQWVFFLPWNVIFQTCKATCWDFKMRNSNHGTAQQQLFISACSYIFSTCLNPGLHYQKVFHLKSWDKVSQMIGHQYENEAFFFALLNFFKDFVGTRFLWIPITLTRSPFNLFFLLFFYTVVLLPDWRLTLLFPLSFLSDFSTIPVHLSLASLQVWSREPLPRQPPQRNMLL